jgi:BirA family biotin operon repressor/biotin-[acetyl-CoA-carboxylase] ligase
MALTPTRQRLLRLLADGEFHSGADLGEELGISRTAVWKALAGLDDLGLSIERVPRRGYRIPGGIDLHDAGAIRAALSVPARALLDDLRVLAVVDSTNEVLKATAESVPGLGTCCLAEWQTGGRGRLGRRWVSPFASNLYLSVAWEFDGGIAVLEGLSLAVGVAVRRALLRLGVAEVQLKWPNDLLRDHAKLGGILVEVTGDPEGRCRAIVGIGINVVMPAAAAAGIGQPWRDLSDLGVRRDALAAAVLDQLLPLLSEFPARGFGGYRDDWEAAHAHGGRRVLISAGTQRVEGIARGVNERGALGLECAEGLRWFSGGEVSLREQG